MVTSAEADGQSDTVGALISELSAGGAAEQAGLQAGDVVTEFDLETREVGRSATLPGLCYLRVIGQDPAGLAPWLSWKVWCEAMGVARPGASRGLTFSHYDQVVQSAVAGQGIALGRFPLLDPFVAERRLVLPLKGRQYATLERRAYWLVAAPGAAQRPEVQTFVAWMRKQVAAQKSAT